MDNCRFSIVIPTINRTNELGALLESLCEQTNQNFEVIIVDQNQDDRLDDVVKPFIDRINLQHLKVSFKGAARARNYGSKYVKGEILNFADDDSAMCNTTLAFIDEKFKEGNDIDAAFGKIVDPTDGTPILHFYNNDTKVSKRNVYRTCIECNMFIKTATFKATGGFDERLGVGTHFGAEEGADLFFRLLYKNYNLFFYNKVVFNHPSKKEYASLERARGYGIGFGGFVRKHMKEYRKYTPLMYMIYYNIKALLCIVIFSILGNNNRAVYNRTVFHGRITGFKEWSKVVEN